MVYAILWAGPTDDRAPIVRVQSASDLQAIPPEYTSYMDIFSTEKAGLLPTHKASDHAIDLDGKDPPYGPLYNLSNTELKVLQEYLNDALACQDHAELVMQIW